MAYTSPISALVFTLVVYFYLKKKKENGHLDRFPGPFLARWTTFYKKYYDLVKGGEWVEQLQYLHRIYGSVVRVGPNELHFSSPEAYHEIHAVGSKFTKDEATYRPILGKEHVFAILDPQEAMTRRSIILPYFSRRSVQDREWILQQKTETFIEQLVIAHNNEGKPIDLQETLRHFIGGLVPAYMFPNMGQCSELVSSALLSNVTDVPTGIFPWQWFKSFPRTVIPILLRTMGALSKLSVAEWKAFVILVDDALDSSFSEVDEQNESIAHSLLKRSLNHRPESTRQWLLSEVLNAKYAGMDTTSSAAFVTIRAVLADDAVRGRLMADLDGVRSDGGWMSGTVLEKLPYLTAVIKEGIRLSVGIVSPMNRVVGPDDTVISGNLIPAGTTVGIAHSLVLLNPDVFSDPHVFRPERWLEGDSHKLDKHFVAFARGPRACVGIQQVLYAVVPSKLLSSVSDSLAWTILYITVANIFKRLDLSPTSVDTLRAPLRIKDQFISVFVGSPVHVHVEPKTQ